MRAYMRFCALLLILAALLLCTACTFEGEPQHYDTENHSHSFSGEWYDVAPAEEGAPVTEEVHYCRICHAAETRPKSTQGGEQ